MLQARLIGAADIVISGLDAADRAVPGQMTFVRTAKFVNAWKESQASAAMVAADIAVERLVPDGMQEYPGKALIVVADVDLAMIQVLERFMPAQEPRVAGVHPHASVHPDAKVDASASIGPNCSIAAGAVIGANAVLVANVSVGFNAKIGAGTVLYPNVVVYERCEVGAGCMLHAGVIIGADGFGYHPRPDGRGVMKIPHIGNVVIHDGVEIGANTCIDKGKFGSTVVGAGTKIDNLVQVGHNCRIGRSCIMCGESGLAGSVTLGDGVVVGGRAAVSDNVTVGSGAKIAGYSGVTSDVPPGAVYMGVPAGPANEWRRIYASLRKMGKPRSTLKDL